MLSLHIEKREDMVVVECEGRMVHSEAAFVLRDAVMSQTRAHIVVLDFSELEALGGGGLGMLAFLQRWAYDHDIRLKLFNPRRFIQDKLEHTNSMPAFEIATLDEMMALLGQADKQYAVAS